MGTSACYQCTFCFFCVSIVACHSFDVVFLGICMGLEVIIGDAVLPLIGLHIARYYSVGTSVMHLYCVQLAVGFTTREVLGYRRKANSDLKRSVMLWKVVQRKLYKIEGLTVTTTITTQQQQHKQQQKQRENMHTARCGNTSGQKCHAKGSRKESEAEEFMYGDTTNVEYEICDYTGNNWGH
jgi:hypothetical protein